MYLLVVRLTFLDLRAIGSRGTTTISSDFPTTPRLYRGWGTDVLEYCVTLD